MLGILAICGVLSGVTTAGRDPGPAVARQPQARVIRVMPVGDSLTAAPHYRRALLEMTASDGLPVLLVGPSDDAERGGHAGVSGASIGQINDALAAHLQTYRPEVVLMLIGTNNMNHGLGMSGSAAKGYPTDADGRVIGAMPAGAIGGSYLDGLGATWRDPAYGSVYLAGQLKRLMETVVAAEARLIISTIPPIARGPEAAQVGNQHCISRIEEYNRMIRTVAETINLQHPGAVVVVDPYPLVRREPGGPGDSDFGPMTDQAQDWVHPKPWAKAWVNIARCFYVALCSHAGLPGVK
jgi:hypothetical protein